MLLAMNLSVISGSKRNPTLNNLSIKSLMKTAIADDEACVEAYFYPANYKQDTDTYICWNLGEICGTAKNCFYDPGNGMCQSTTCTNP